MLEKHSELLLESSMICAGGYLARPFTLEVHVSCRLYRIFDERKIGLDSPSANPEYRGVS